jgi:hypothetical protein
MGEFIQEEYSPVCQGYLPRSQVNAATDHSCQCARGVGGTYRAAVDEGKADLTGRTANLGHFESLCPGEGRQECPDSLYQHGLATARRTDDEEMMTSGHGYLQGSFGFPRSCHLPQIARRGVRPVVSTGRRTGQ